MDLRGISADVMFRLNKLCGRLIERSQNPDAVSLEATQRYEDELKLVVQNLPTTKQLEGYKHFSFDELYDRCLAVQYHHHVRTLLHLPFMLKSVTERRFEPNRIAALESAREVIRSYTILRAGIHGGYCACKIVDFQVFLVAVVLSLNQMAFVPLINNGIRTEQDDHDWQLVEDVKLMLEGGLREVYGQQGSMLESAIKTLDLLLTARDGAGCDARGGDLEQPTRISIPYFGTITVKPRAETVAAYLQVQQQQLQTPSQTLSSAASPISQLSQSWQLPTPPSVSGGVGSTNTSDTSHAANSYMAFDPVNLPMPSCFDNAPAIPDTADFTFNNTLPNDWAAGYDWSNIPMNGIDLDLDSEWKWVTGNGNDAAKLMQNGGMSSMNSL